MLWHPSLQDTLPGKGILEQRWDGAVRDAARELGQENPMPDCSRALRVKGLE